MERRRFLQAAVALGLSCSRLRAALATAAPIPKGPYQPEWDSLRAHYKTPLWFTEGKFGIFIHWGVYAVPAYHNEWYAKHMYGAFAKWHTEHYGPPDQFGYKDLIPLFKAEKFDPDSWAALFKKSGARYVVPVAEHHDGFAMWDSNLTAWCAGKMGPKRDLIGDLAKAVRNQGLIFGLSSHRMEHHAFMYPAEGVKSDQFDPKYADFYGPPVPGNMNDGNASAAFQEDWLARCQELIDKYQPQMIYFDNGVNSRSYDAIKLRCAAYYYNRAMQWGKGATFATKDSAYLEGSVLDFEKAVRGPKDIMGGAWQIDDQIATNTWGYTNDIAYRTTNSILLELADIVSKGGNLLLNISPRADGTIPSEQQQILGEIGDWLGVNGEAVYSARPWKQFGEAPESEVANPKRAMTRADFRFSVHRDALYCFGLVRPPAEAVIHSLGTGSGRVSSVALLGGGKLVFTQSPQGLSVKLPEHSRKPGPYVMKITGIPV